MTSCLFIRNRSTWCSILSFGLILYIHSVNTLCTHNLVLIIIQHDHMLFLFMHIYHSTSLTCHICLGSVDLKYYYVFLSQFYNFILYIYDRFFLVNKHMIKDNVYYLTLLVLPINLIRTMVDLLTMKNLF